MTRANDCNYQEEIDRNSDSFVGCKYNDEMMCHRPHMVECIYLFDKILKIEKGLDLLMQLNNVPDVLYGVEK